MRGLRWRRQQDESGLSVTIGQPAQLKSVSFKKVLEGRRNHEEEQEGGGGSDSDVMLDHAKGMANFRNQMSTTKELRRDLSSGSRAVSSCPTCIQMVHAMCLSFVDATQRCVCMFVCVCL